MQFDMWIIYLFHNFLATTSPNMADLGGSGGGGGEIDSLTPHQSPRGKVDSLICGATLYESKSFMCKCLMHGESLYAQSNCRTSSNLVQMNLVKISHRTLKNL